MCYIHGKDYGKKLFHKFDIGIKIKKRFQMKAFLVINNYLII